MSETERFIWRRFAEEVPKSLRLIWKDEEANRFCKKSYAVCDGGESLKRGANRSSVMVIGEGIVSVKRRLAILKSAGCDGFVTVEYEGSEDCPAGFGVCRSTCGALFPNFAERLE